MSAEQWPVWDMITLSEAPAAAADVARPALSECPSIARRIKPDRLRSPFDYQRHSLIRQPPGLNALKRSSDLNTGPSTILAVSSQAWSDLTGHALASLWRAFVT